jgi:hypothetical protein
MSLPVPQVPQLSAAIRNREKYSFRCEEQQLEPMSCYKLVELYRCNILDMQTQGLSISGLDISSRVLLLAQIQVLVLARAAQLYEEHCQTMLAFIIEYAVLHGKSATCLAMSD